MPDSRLLNIQALRALAAMAVVLGHATAGPLDMGVAWNGWVSHAGVDLFFTISGFIITTIVIAAGAESGPRLALRFLIKRTVRIYPIYWIVLVSVLAVSTIWFPLHDAQVAMPTHGVAPLFFLLTITNTFVPQSWSMVFEVYFYAVVTVILLIAARHVMRVGALWLALQAGYFLYALHAGTADSSIFCNAQVLEFGLGSACAHLTRWRPRAAWPSVALSVPFFVAGAIHYLDFPDHVMSGSRLLTFGIASALLLDGALQLERRGVRAGGWLQATGDASYSIYLWHQALLWCLTRVSLTSGLADHLPHPLLLVVWLIVILGWGLLSYRYIERPLIKQLNKALLSNLAPPPSVAPLAL